MVYIRKAGEDFGDEGRPVVNVGFVEDVFEMSFDGQLADGEFFSELPVAGLRGPGAGLAICKKIIEGIGGKI